MGHQRSYKTYSKEFKDEAVALVHDQGCSVPEAAKSLVLATNLLYRWKQAIEDQHSGKALAEDEKDIKKSQRLLCERKEVGPLIAL